MLKSDERLIFEMLITAEFDEDLVQKDKLPMCALRKNSRVIKKTLESNRSRLRSYRLQYTSF